jgi:DNA-binding transcriptional ArsR family regulator
MTTTTSPAREDIRLCAVLSALSDRTRLDIVRKLLDVPELSCKDFDLRGAKSTLSHHFRTLREAGITTLRVDGTLHWNSLRRDDLEARFPGLLEMLHGASKPY